MTLTTRKEAITLYVTQVDTDTLVTRLESLLDSLPQGIRTAAWNTIRDEVKGALDNRIDVASNKSTKLADLKDDLDEIDADGE